MADTSGARRRIIQDPNAALPTSNSPAQPAGTDASLPPWQRSAASPSTQPTPPSLNTQVLAERVAQNRAALTATLSASVGALNSLHVGLDAAAAQAAGDAAATRRSLGERAEATYRQGQEELARRTAAERAHAVSATTNALSRLAPGAASAAWSRLAGPVAAHDRSLADFQRVGAYLDGDLEIPVIHPLRIGSGWQLTGDSHATGDLLLGTLARLILQVDPRNLRIHSFDPRSSGSLARLAGLRALNPATFPRPHATASTFVDVIRQALSNAPVNAEKVALSGARNFSELLRSDLGTDATLSVFVVLDYPYALTPDLSDALEQLASLGPSAGTLLLIQDVDRAPAPDRSNPDRLRSLLPRITLTEGRVSSEATAPIPTVADPVIDAPALEQIIESVAARVRSNVGRTVRLDELIAADIANPWTRSSVHELEATLGVTGDVPLTVSFRTENPPHSNVLLGGMVGTGKSNALKDLIYSLAVRYSPEELDLILLDFKSGIEFKSFDGDTTGWLPHVSILGLESDQTYGVAVLSSVAAEIHRRSTLFRDAGGAASIVRYRESTGRPLPRLVVVIDEFHVILEGDEELAQRAADLLELIAKQGRAFGVHLLLASQALTGIRGLRAKADAIFAQFPVRLSLKNSASESQAFLSQGNRAAADLTHRGEVIVNRNLGQDPEADNVRGLAAFVEQETFAEVQRKLWARSPDRPPRVFIGSSFAAVNPRAVQALAPSTPGAPAAALWIGRPVAVDDAPATIPLTADADQLVALVGSDQGRVRVAPAVLASMIFSAVRTLPPDSELIILDASGDDTLAQLQPTLDDARRRGMTVQIVSSADIAEYARTTLADRVADRASQTAQLVVGLGLQRVPGMDDAPAAATVDAVGFSFGASSVPTARDVFANLSRQGALAGVFFIGWWSNVAALEQTIGLSHSGVLAYVTVGAGLEDLKRIAGPLTKSLGASPRVGLYDRRSEVGLHSAVPFASAISVSAQEVS